MTQPSRPGGPYADLFTRAERRFVAEPDATLDDEAALLRVTLHRLFASWTGDTRGASALGRLVDSLVRLARAQHERGRDAAELGAFDLASIAAAVEADLRAEVHGGRHEPPAQVHGGRHEPPAQVAAASIAEGTAASPRCRPRELPAHVASAPSVGCSTTAPRDAAHDSPAPAARDSAADRRPAARAARAVVPTAGPSAGEAADWMTGSPVAGADRRRARSSSPAVAANASLEEGT